MVGFVALTKANGIEHYGAEIISTEFYNVNIKQMANDVKLTIYFQL